MRGLKENWKTGLVLLLLALMSSVHADDTEIFFAKAKADNEQNQSKANVMILLDTSGSMRSCKTPNGTSWCYSQDEDEGERRIDMLEKAMHALIDKVSPDVRIGLSRFRHNTMNDGVAAGGYVLMPVMDLNEQTRALLKSKVSELNSRGNDYGDPRGGTPTAKTYWETARYMMGLSPVSGSYGSQSWRDNTSTVCVETKEIELEDTCYIKFDGWGEWQMMPPGTTCNPDLPTCKVEYGDWQPSEGCDVGLGTCQAASYGPWTRIEGVCDESDVCRRVESDWEDIDGTCNVSQANCRYSDWSPWVITRASGANGYNCKENQNTLVFQRRREEFCARDYGLFCGRKDYRCEERVRSYQQKSYHYETRDVTGFEQRDTTYFVREGIYVKECDTAVVCAKQVDIVKNNVYVSPMNMDNQCESNHIVIFTDGAPSSGALPDDDDLVSGVSCDGSGAWGDYNCQISISNYLEGKNSTARPIKTYNVGLHMGGNRSNMENVSTDGEEGTFTASNADELADAFLKVLDLIKEDARSYSTPGVAVNQMNRLEHLDQLYYAVFEPKEASYWDGNVKRYRLHQQSIRDAANQPAVDPKTAFFDEDSRSFWSSEADGPDVRLGGARENLEGRRLFYTDENGNMAEIDWEDDVDPVLFGLPEDADEETVGELKNILKTMWGDPLHSQPMLVNYGGGSDNNVIFVSANDGMLKAIDSRDGSEYFSWMPSIFMQQANRFTIDRPALAQDNSRQLYGLDGSWTAWRRPGATPSSAPSAVYLYGGMRRGGDSYYALDVSDLDNPQLLWEINRGDTGFQRLGQTWSQPTLTQVMVNDSPRPVLIFGGGYSDEDHDRKQGAARSGVQDAMGNMIYIVDALTGNLIWSAGRSGSGDHHTTVSDMSWAVPSNISVVDISFDSMADYLYFGDLGGQVWRVDLNQSDVTKSTVHKLAQLSGSGASDNRRFFYPPAVAYVKGEQDQDYLYVTIGSGYRAHPLDESVDDYFFTIKDRTAMSGATPETVEIGDLTTISGSTVPDSEASGWKIALPDNGEKVTAASTVFDGHVFFTTYQPGSKQPQTNPCAVRMGTTYLYVLNLVTGAAGEFPGINIDSSTRRTELGQDALAPTPAWITDGDNMALVVGTEVIGSDSIGSTGMRRGSWYQLEPQEADLIPVSPE